tara:strand:+ start:92 stop:340 length:249 start_codon:yes stop_codon:yes gene_type:complete
MSKKKEVNFQAISMDNNIYYNKADGTGYFFDGNNWYMMPRNADETYDYDCISCVDEMHSDGCSEQDIDSVNKFLNFVCNGRV